MLDITHVSFVCEGPVHIEKIHVFHIMDFDVHIMTCMLRPYIVHNNQSHSDKYVTNNPM